MAEGRWRGLGRFLRSVRFRPYDAVVYLVALGVVLGFSVLALEQRGVASTVELRSDAGVFVYALNEEHTIRFNGPLGETVVEISDGAARFTASPCRDKICIAAGDLTEAGQWAACLPNRVFMTVTGEPAADGSGVDATAF